MRDEGIAAIADASGVKLSTHVNLCTRLLQHGKRSTEISSMERQEKVMIFIKY